MRLPERDFISVSASCRQTGRCFSHQASHMQEEGELHKSDPRVVHRSVCAHKPILPNEDTARSLYSSALSTSTAVEGLDPSKLSTADMARHLEFYAHEMARNRHPGPSADIARLIGAAALICDTDILNERHRDGAEMVSVIAHKSGQPPPFVLSGMLRSKLIQPTDCRIVAFTDGYLDEHNQLDRNQFLVASKRAIAPAIHEIQEASATPFQKSSIARSFAKLKACETGPGSPEARETAVMQSASVLCEGLAMIWSEARPERAKELASLSMSAAERSQVLSAEPAIEDQSQVKSRPIIQR